MDVTTSPTTKPKPRPRPQVMRLTEAAATRVRELTARTDSEIIGLRVGIKNGGCAGQSYTVEYAHDIKPTDEVVEDKGVKILVEGQITRRLPDRVGRDLPGLERLIVEDRLN